MLSHGTSATRSKIKVHKFRTKEHKKPDVIWEMGSNIMAYLIHTIIGEFIKRHQRRAKGNCRECFLSSGRHIASPLKVDLVGLNRFWRGQLNVGYYLDTTTAGYVTTAQWCCLKCHLDIILNQYLLPYVKISNSSFCFFFIGVFSGMRKLRLFLFIFFLSLSQLFSCTHKKCNYF